MRADDWIVNYLIEKGVTDVFGIPGMVVMDFLYAVDKRKPDITPHLNYHEQGSAFAAVGYAQSSGKLGVAYSTRGPGFTNMLTAMADAFYDSVPVMFITAHSAKKLESKMRVMNNQEIDTVSFAMKITKMAIRIDDLDNLQSDVMKAYRAATTERKGPVFIDFWNGLFSQEVEETVYDDEIVADENTTNTNLLKLLQEKLNHCKRPVILIGNGARNEECKVKIKAIAEKYSIPVLSSRAGQDIVPDSPYYFGFVGSRATRYSNFILSKADLIISLGNRLSFPIKSKSFFPVVENTDIVRIDVDNTEFIRQIPNSINYNLDCMTALAIMEKSDLRYNNSDSWIKICCYLKQKLNEYDKNSVISMLMNIIGSTAPETNLICDVGNHSFWVTTAYSYQKARNRIMYSSSFGTLGSAFPKAIGAYYANRKPVICFSGDQGIQFNIQELEYISKHRIPVTIVILNNASSGMIMEREIAKHGEYLVHTTTDSGYDFPDFEELAGCYGIDYTRIVEGDAIDYKCDNNPHIIEMVISMDTVLEPSLPIGKACQDLSPELPRELYEELNRL